MKKLLLLLTLVGMFVTACEEAGVDGGVNGPAVSYDHNKIWYTNGSTSKPTLPSDLSAFGGASLVSNEYDTKKECWVITFDRNVTTIGDEAFYDCSSLISITIPNGVLTIGELAFRGCSSLTSITIPDSVVSIGDSAFRGCSSLTSITIPDGVTSIGYCAFYNCSSLTSITIPDGVTSIGRSAFDGCGSLTSITIPDSVVSIEGFAFCGCSSLTSITIPDSVMSIERYAFHNCSSLTSITIPDSVTSIGDSAFSGCSSLTSITIPDGVTSIEEYAFAYCSSMKEVYCKSTTPPAGGLGMFSDNPWERKIYVPTESVEAYKAAEYWENYADAIVGYEYDGGNPDQPDQPTITVLTLTADKTVVTLGETIKFTVTMGEQDVTYAAIIYDAETLDVVRNGVFSPTSTGTYSFFATEGGESSNYVYVTVMASVPTLPEDTDVANTKFNHRILVIDHTGINDSYSPLMTDNLRAFHKTEWVNNYNEVTCHAGPYAGGDPANSPAANVVNQFYGPSGYPALNLNFYSGDVPNYYTDTFVVKMGEEFTKLIKKDGADAGIAVAVTGDSEMVYATVSVKAAVEQEYKVTAWLLESKIYGNQSGASEDYHKIYNHALRNIGGTYSKNDISGDSVGVIKVGEYAETGFELPITSTNWKVENMDVLIIVSAKDNTGRWEVVNTALCPVNSTVDFEYME